MNALSHALAWVIVAEVQKAAHDDNVWVIALTGNGRAFCAGLDLSGPGEDVSPLPPQERLMDDVSWVGRFAPVLRHECDKPVVAELRASRHADAGGSPPVALGRGGVQVARNDVDESIHRESTARIRVSLRGLRSPPRPAPAPHRAVLAVPADARREDGRLDGGEDLRGQPVEPDVRRAVAGRPVAVEPRG
jgi:hypothetical protein